MENYSIRATDGDIGHVKDFYFDDGSWVVRYLVVEAGSWLSSKKVLISPISIYSPNWQQKVLPVGITKDQVRNCPDIDTDKPVSLQYQSAYHDYYGYPYYWGGDAIWGAGLYPIALVPGYVNGEDAASRKAAETAYWNAERDRHSNDDPRLRSCKAIVGYHILATDGSIGHVESLIIDQDTWAVRYFVVNTSNWWVGHKVLVSPQWITGVDWGSQTVSIDMSQHAIRTAPAFGSTDEMNRSREHDLYTHHGRTHYWPDPTPTAAPHTRPDTLRARASEGI